MKALILSDIHANYPALKAVLEKVGSYDKLFFLGDVVDYGPNPKECVEFIKQNADYYVRGNHDNALGYGVDCQCMGTFREYSVTTREWHKTLLDESDKKFLREMPILNTITLDGKTFFLAHASPTGDMFKYLNKDEIENEIDGIKTDFIMVGHTHVQYIKKTLHNITIFNPGSVGLSREESKACYAVYENGNIILNKIDYDVEKTISDLKKSPLPQNIIMGLEKVLLHK
jgi:putative phosphoesterase